MHAERIGLAPRALGLTLVAAAVLCAYGCSKEEPKQAKAPATTTAAAPAPAAAPADEAVTVTIGHAGPLTGGIAHLGKDDENGVHLAVDEATHRLPENLMLFAKDRALDHCQTASRLI